MSVSTLLTLLTLGEGDARGKTWRGECPGDANMFGNNNNNLRIDDETEGPGAAAKTIDDKTEAPRELQKFCQQNYRSDKTEQMVRKL